MLNRMFWQKFSVRTIIRLVQFIFVFFFLWSFFWAHIYEMIVWNKTFVESLSYSTLNILLYLVSIAIIICLEVYLKYFQSKPTKTPISSEAMVHSATQEPSLKNEVMFKHEKTPSNKTGIVFLVIGVVITIFSIYESETTVAFIGLSLTFWGALFIFVRARRFVGSNVLCASVISTYKTIDRLVDDSDYSGTFVYMPSHPSENLPNDDSANPKELTVFVSSASGVNLSSIGESQQRKLLDENSKGVYIVPPGFGLVNLFEQELKSNFTAIDQDGLYSALSMLIFNFELANSFEFSFENGVFHLKIVDSVYKVLYSKEQGLKSVRYLGCPLTSAIACALTKITGKALTITKIDVTPNLKIIDVWYQMNIEG